MMRSRRNSFVRPRAILGRILFMALLATCATRAQSVIEGRVELPKSRSAPVMNKRYEIVSKGGVLSTNPPLAVVYLEGDFPRQGPLPIKQINQKNLTFEPALLAVQTGTKVEFPNQDDVYHNVFSYSSAKRFDLGRYRSEERPIPSQIFDKPGLVTLRCDIHEHMRALILVLSTPHFVLSDSDGRFRLAGIPAGHHILKTWIDSRTILEHAVDTRAGASLKVNFP
jgi:plastocyanin